MSHKQLAVESVIGFNGALPSGLLAHPDGAHMLYPLGSTVVVRKLGDLKPSGFLHGHSNRVSVVSISHSGRYVASGQIAPLGFQAEIIIWDFATLKPLHRLSLHKVRVQGLAFSHDERFLASIGGVDDKQICVWDVESGKALCGGKYGSDEMTCLTFYRNNSNKLVVAGSLSVRIWDIDLVQRKMQATDTQLGKLKRNVVCVDIDTSDSTVYCGTDSGDVLAVSLVGALALKTYGPSKGLSLGIHSVTFVPANGVPARSPLRPGGPTIALKEPCLLVGSGDGTVLLLDAVALKPLVAQTGVVTSVHVEGGVTSIGLLRASSSAPAASASSSRLQSTSTAASSNASSALLIGTTLANVYTLSLGVSPQGTLMFAAEKADLRQTCHHGRINDVAFPPASGDVFATCSSEGDIRVWNAKTCAELLRITVPNLTCNCVAFMRDGSAVLSGWSDGKMRAFGPQSGKLLFVIHDAHLVGAATEKKGGRGASGALRGVTAIAVLSDGQRILTGGSDGQVRLWAINTRAQPITTTMLASMKEHKGTVNAVRVRKNDAECVSASDDGSCIVWDLKRFVRANIVYAQTYFKDVAYLNDESQMVTVGTDRKVGFWDAYDCTAIREVDGSATGELYAGVINNSGTLLATGGEDQIVRLWDYDEGDVKAVGVGHSGAVTRIRFAPDDSRLVSVGDEGAIFLWRPAA